MSEFQFNPFDVSCQHDPRRLAFFREASPVVQLFPAAHGKPAMYLALRLAEIDTVLRQRPEFGVASDEQRLMHVEPWPLLTLLLKTMPFSLGGEAHDYAHAIFNQMVQEALRGNFRRRIANQVAEEIKRFRQACLQASGFDDGVFDDEVIDLAWYFNLVCTRLILLLVGLPQELAATIIRWNGAFAIVADRSASVEAFARADEAVQAFWDLLIPLLDALPLREGVCRMLFRMQEAGALTHDQVIATVLTFIAVASENPPRAVLSLVRGLYAFPDQLQLLQGRGYQERSSRQLPGSMLAAVDEAICWDTSIGYIMRSALSPCVLGGFALQAGDEIACIPEAVHTNGAFRPEPEQFRIQRPTRVIRSFGGGAWACLGQRLARDMVGYLGMSLLVDEHPRICFTGRELYGDNSFFRTPAHVYVTCAFDDESR